MLGMLYIFLYTGQHLGRKVSNGYQPQLPLQQLLWQCQRESIQCIQWLPASTPSATLPTLSTPVERNESALCERLFLEAVIPWYFLYNIAMKWLVELCEARKSTP